MFVLQAIPLLPTKSLVNWPFGSEAQNSPSNGGFGRHLGYLIETILGIFGLKVALILSYQVRISWPFRSGEEYRNTFLRKRLWSPSWISDRNDFSYFISTSHPDTSYQVSSQLAFRIRRIISK